jgi:hypothetical protein
MLPIALLLKTLSIAHFKKLLNFLIYTHKTYRAKFTAIYHLDLGTMDEFVFATVNSRGF